MVSKGVKIDNNLLKQIHMENIDYLFLTLNSEIIINNILDSRVFEYMKYFDKDIVTNMKNKIALLRLQ